MIKKRYPKISQEPLFYPVRYWIACVYATFVCLLDSGKVLKAINAASADTNEKVSPVVIEELFEFGGPGTTAAVRNIKLEDKRLLVVTDRQVVSLPLDKCQNPLIATCRYEYYCTWCYDLQFVEEKPRFWVALAYSLITSLLKRQLPWRCRLQTFENVVTYSGSYRS